MMKTDKELAEELQNDMSGDPECDHGNADDFIAEVLEGAGYPLLAAKYKELSEDFWYA